MSKIVDDLEKIISKHIKEMLKSYCMDGDIIWNNDMMTIESVAKFQAKFLSEDTEKYIKEEILTHYEYDMKEAYKRGKESK